MKIDIRALPNDLLGLLPASVQDIVCLIGVQAALRLVSAWPGRTFPVSRNKRLDGRVRFEALAEVVGHDAAEILSRHYADSELYIPQCAIAMRELRDRLIRADFDRITGSEGHSARAAVVMLVDAYGVSDRHVWRVLNRADWSAKNYNSQQADLFSVPL
ncbi:Mor transcription activator family protein [Chitinimonas sp.]|uniref:Mor transcription activator family protein n=1 Tax=Chitinimonas sp. TaxID=1934313 RepID=UPI0035B3C140